MGCSKILTLTGGCPLSTCLNQAGVYIPAGEPGTGTESAARMAFAPDACYCLVNGTDATFSNTFFYKYDPATNTLVQKATLGFGIGLLPIYDATQKLFVTMYLDGGTVKIWTFNPISEAVVIHDTGDTIALTSMLYVSQKGRIYGTAGVDGLGNVYVGYLDFTTFKVIRLGTFPSAGGSHPGSAAFYFDTTNSLYGPYVSAGFSGLCKFDLTTNIGSLIMAGNVWTGQLWDSDREYMMMTAGFSGIDEVDLVTESIVAHHSPADPTIDVRGGGIYVPMLGKAFFPGFDLNSGNDVIISFDTTTFAFAFKFKDDYQYVFPMISLGDNSAMAAINDLPQTKAGVRRICLE